MYWKVGIIRWIACMENYFYNELNQNISKLTDTEKALRKMGLGLLSTEGFLNTKLSYDFMIRIIDTLHQKCKLEALYEDYSDDLDKFKQFYEYINQYISI